jgi:hypothetical protein
MTPGQWKCALCSVDKLEFSVYYYYFFNRGLLVIVDFKGYFVVPCYLKHTTLNDIFGFIYQQR